MKRSRRRELVDRVRGRQVAVLGLESGWWAGEHHPGWRGLLLTSLSPTARPCCTRKATWMMHYH